MKRKRRHTNMFIDWSLVILEIFIYVPRLLLKGLAKALEDIDLS